MLLFIDVAEGISLFIQHMPILALLVAAPLAIVLLGFISIAVATFAEQQLPLQKPQEGPLGRET